MSAPHHQCHNHAILSFESRLRKRPRNAIYATQDLRRLLVSPLDQSRELIKLNVFPHDRALGLVLLVYRYLDNIPINFPSADFGHEVVEVGSRVVQPVLQDRSLYLAYTLADFHCDLHTHQVLESNHVGDEVGEEIIAIESGPEGAVVTGGDLVAEFVQLLDSLGEGGVACCGV